MIANLQSSAEQPISSWIRRELNMYWLAEKVLNLVTIKPENMEGAAKSWRLRWEHVVNTHGSLKPRTLFPAFNRQITWHRVVCEMVEMPCNRPMKQAQQWKLAFARHLKVIDERLQGHTSPIHCRGVISSTLISMLSRVQLILVSSILGRRRCPCSPTLSPRGLHARKTN